MADLATSVTVLEPAARQFADAVANPPFLFELGPEKGRQTFDEVQSAEIEAPAVDVSDMHVISGQTVAIPVRIVRPRKTVGPLPVVLYVHGAGWVFGDALTHDRLIRELADGAGAARLTP